MNFYIVALKNIGNIFIKYFIKHPIVFSKIAKIGLDLKPSINNLNEKDLKIKTESTINIIEAIVRFKNENPNDFDIVFNILEDILKDYKNNPKTKEAIMSILDKINQEENNKQLKL